MLGATFYAGILLASAVGTLAMGTLFFRAFRLRPADSEYLLFALLAVALSVYTGGLAWSYLGVASAVPPEHANSAAIMTTAGGIVCSSLALHFSLRLVGSTHEREVMVPSYLASLFYLTVLLTGRWWHQAPSAKGAVIETRLGAVLTPVVHPTPIAFSFYVLVMVIVLLMLGMVARAYMAKRTELASTLVGTVVLSATGFNDALLRTGKSTGLYLAPVGFFFFALGVTMTLVSRYGLLSVEFEQRGADLRKRTRELRRSYRALKQAQAELVRKEQLAVVGELAAVIAHEVRNPLAIIGNAVAGLRREVEIEDKKLLLEIIDEESLRLNRLVSDLLCYARPVAPQLQLLSLADTMKRALVLAERAELVRVTLDVDAAAPRIWADASLLRQVFENVISNAIQAMHEEGTLDIRIRPGDREGAKGVAIEIQDTGEGMDTQVRSRVGTPFFTTRPSGTGLGLAIVERIIDAHGGVMTIESRTGEGTTVRLFLPERAPEEPDSDVTPGVST